MCGIAGYIGFNEISKKTVLNTLELMKNRGPDSQNFKKYQHNNFNIYLLHSRLNIIDLRNLANQPFIDGDHTLIFNGEIYNYIELKNELKKKGVKFKTKSDSEVLLKAYIYFGKEAFNKFEGMWSLAIWDNKKKEIILSRDRFGEKPLYIYKTLNGFFFGSEIKFIKSLSNKNFSISNKQISRYLIQGYKSLYKEEDTFYKKIKHFPKSCFLIINKSLNVNFKKYWHLEYRPKQIKIDEVINKTKKLLDESVKLRLRSDVPIAFSLSGGIDSNTLIYLASKRFKSKVKAYSILDADKDYNEKKFIDISKKELNLDIDYIKVDTNNAFGRLEELINYHDQPIATSNFLFHSIIAQKAQLDGYKILISGQGSDELFTGYYDHAIQYLYETRNHDNYKENLAHWKRYVLKDIQNPIFQNPNLYIDNPRYREHLFDRSDQLKKYLKEKHKKNLIGKNIEKNYSKSLLRNRMMNELFHEGVPVCLNNEDMNCMYYSVENRSPFLDSKLCKFMYTVPSDLLMQQGFTKFILRKSMEGLVNNKILFNRVKKGFNVSVNSFINFDHDSFKENFLQKNNLAFDFIDRNKLINLIKFSENRKKYSKFLFNFVNTSIFLKNF